MVIASGQHRLDAFLFFLEFLEREVHLFAREGVDREAGDALVLAAGAGHGHAVHGAFGNAVGTVGGNAHGDPPAVGAQGPVAHVIDGGVGGGGRGGDAARIDDGGAALADLGNEFVLVPG